jgi:hypothetical protein
VIICDYYYYSSSTESAFSTDYYYYLLSTDRIRMRGGHKRLNIPGSKSKIGGKRIKTALYTAKQPQMRRGETI